MYLMVSVKRKQKVSVKDFNRCSQPYEEIFVISVWAWSSQPVGVTVLRGLIIITNKQHGDSTPYSTVVTYSEAK